MTAPAIAECLEDIGVYYAVDKAICSPLLTGLAELVIYPEAKQMPAVMEAISESGEGFHVLGSGSNTLLDSSPDRPIQTPVISTKKMRSITTRAHGVVTDDIGVEVDLAYDKSAVEETVTADAGALISRTSQISSWACLSGLEFACGIPGTVAGAIATDAWHPIHNYAELFEEEGLHDHEKLWKHISRALLSAEVVTPDGKISTLTPDELGMGGRTSNLRNPDNNQVLISATFGLESGDPLNIGLARQAIQDGRRSMRSNNKAKNPHSVGRTLGYTFVQCDPSYGGQTAANLIETAEGLPDEVASEGMMHSKATANIICNTGDGTSAGYLRLAEDIKQAVSDTHGVELPLEIEVIR